MVCSDAVSGALPSGMHGSTFGGNPVAAAAAIATWDLATAPTTLAQVVDKGAYFRELAEGLKSRRAGRIIEVRGKGLLWGIEVDQGAADVVARCREGGLLVNLAGEKTIRFAPSFLVSTEQLREGLAIFEAAL